MNSQPKHIDLRPNRHLLDSNFDGYKLSLEEIPVKKLTLPAEVDRVQPSKDQYSLLHTRMFALHNHLFNDNFNRNSVYYIDNDRWCVKKCTVDEITEEILLEDVWSVPLGEARTDGAYNLSLCFVSNELAVIADGLGSLHIVSTGDRSKPTTWTALFSDKILPETNGFVILTGRYEPDQKVHCVLAHVRHNAKHFESVLDWMTISPNGNGENWQITAHRQLCGRGCIYYCALEPKCEAIYVASDSALKFVYDSENTVVHDDDELTSNKYTWRQTEDEIVFNLSLNELDDEIDKKRLNIQSKADKMTVLYDDAVVFDFEKFTHSIDADLTTWEIREKEVVVTLTKNQSGFMWAQLLEGGDRMGKEIPDPAVTENISLSQVCSDKETSTYVSSQQLEECDATDELTTFERISVLTHKPTHSATPTGGQLLFVKNLTVGNDPPAFCAKHDVDGLVWQPVFENDQMNVRHEGTLLAFAFVQASKQQRKFTDCAPDLSYAVVAESTRHAFIYRQHKAITNGCELRNRVAQRQVTSAAQQQVVNVNGEVLGMCALEKFLFFLTTNQMSVYTIR